LGSRRNTAYRYCKPIRRRRAVARQAALDSIVYTDGRRAYKQLSLNGFHHRRIDLQQDFANGGININGS